MTCRRVIAAALFLVAFAFFLWLGQPKRERIQVEEKVIHIPADAFFIIETCAHRPAPRNCT